MDKAEMFDMALERMMSDLDDVEGSSSTKHSMDDCPDPLGCDMHEDEEGDSLSGPDKEKPGFPSMKGETAAKEVAEHEGGSDNGLSPEEAEELRKLLK